MVGLVQRCSSGIVTFARENDTFVARHLELSCIVELTITINMATHRRRGPPRECGSAVLASRLWYVADPHLEVVTSGSAEHVDLNAILFGTNTGSICLESTRRDPL